MHFAYRVTACTAKSCDCLTLAVKSAGDESAKDSLKQSLFSRRMAVLRQRHLEQPPYIYILIYVYESTSELSKTTLSTAFHSILVFCIFFGER